VLDNNLALPTKKRYSKYGWLALVNRGHNSQGFKICPTCGWAEAVTFTAGHRPLGGGRQGHLNPITGQPCATGTLINKDIGHHYLTDVLEISIQGIPLPLKRDPVYRSFLYALLEGASESQGIKRDDIDGTLYFRIYDESPSFILFDSVPGGAGHVEKIKENLRDAAEAALKKVEKCTCGIDTSCYNCLRNYRNQHFHDSLQRGYAIQVLRLLLGYER